MKNANTKYQVALQDIWIYYKAIAIKDHTNSSCLPSGNWSSRVSQSILQEIMVPMRICHITKVIVQFSGEKPTEKNTRTSYD
jgi:hypothetical protein